MSHNFYIDYNIEAYLAKYVEDDQYDINKKSWSILKDTKMLPTLNCDGCDITQDEKYNEFDCFDGSDQYEFPEESI